MTRRAMLLVVAGAAWAPWALAAIACRSLGLNDRRGRPGIRPVQTATGAIPADRLGLTLMHEHVLVDFIGADQVSPGRYDRDRAFSAVLPHLQQARTLGCDTLVECTPAYL